MSRSGMAIGVAGVVLAGGIAYYATTHQASSSTPAPASSPPAASDPASVAFRDPGTPGSALAIGCGDELWQHVYNPSRLDIENDCVTVTGAIVDATANLATHEADGVRREKDGDIHGWLKVDPPFGNLLDGGNMSDEGGNLVFEIVCVRKPSQEDAKLACPVSYRNTVVIPPVGTHVAITGTLVKDGNHARWREIHPVTSITVLNSAR